MDGLEFAALDLVQHGLSGDAEGLGGIGQPEPALGHLGCEPVPDGLVDADPPGRAGGELLSGEEAVAQPPVEGDFADAEQAFGFRDGDHDGIVVEGSDSFGGRLVGRDAAGDPQRLDPGLGEGSPVPVRRCCRDRISAMVVSS